MPTTSRARLGLALAVLLPVLLLLGCSASVTAGKGGYDPDEVAELVTAAQEKGSPDLPVSGASCPGGVELEVGAVLDCTVEVDGVTAPYGATITSIKGDRAHFDVKPQKAIISTALAVQFITGQLTDQGITDATVDCGAASVIVQDPQTTFPCSIATSKGDQGVTVTINDLDGNVTLAST